MTTALQDLLETVDSCHRTFISVNSLRDKINSLMQKEMETHCEMYRQGMWESVNGDSLSEFNNQFPTHPTNKPLKP